MNKDRWRGVFKLLWIDLLAVGCILFVLAIVFAKSGAR